MAMVCMLHSAAQAQAQDSGDSTPRPTDPEALRLLDEGYRLYEIGEFEKAIEAYKRGATISPGPRFHYNLGQCFRRLRKYDQAIFHFERVASDARVSETVRQYAENFIRDMRDEMANAASSNPPTGPAESLDTTKTGAPNGAELKGSDPVGAAPESHRERWYQDRLGWSVTAVGTVGLLTGIGLQVRASSLYGQADRETDQGQKRTLEDRARTHRIWGAVALVTGGAALATGIVRLALTPESNDSRASAGAGLTVGVNWVGVAGYF
jgi:tetratricopeptide (TPR) repeat protein